MKRRLLLTLLLFVTLTIFVHAIASHSIEHDTEKPIYEVYAVGYGYVPGMAVSFFVEGADQSRLFDAQLMVWLLKGPEGRNILVDCGFHRMEFYSRSFPDMQLKDFIRPDKAVAKLGIKPEEITDIIITHMHFDHAGSLDLFPKAQIWIQKDEFVYYTSNAWQPKGNNFGVDPEDVQALVKLNTEGRVTFINGDDQEPIKGVKVYTGSRHTYASQYLGVNTKVGTVVLASDNISLYENLEKHLPIGLTFDREANLKAQERMKQIASSPRLIVPGHDPAVFKRFPKPGNGIAKIE